MSSNLTKITVEMANAFLSSRNVSFPPCPLCNCSKFSWYTVGEGNVLFFQRGLHFLDLAAQVDDFRATAISYCDNCGYSISFDGYVLLAWLRQRVEGKTDDQHS